MHIEVVEIKNTRLYEYQTQSPSFILSPDQINESISEIQIIISSISLDESLARSSKRGHFMRNSHLTQKVSYYVGVGDRENFAKVGMRQTSAKKQQEDNFILKTPIAMLEQNVSQLNKQEKPMSLPFLQQSKVLKIQLIPYSSYAFPKSQMDQNQIQIGALQIENRQILSMIKQIDQKMSTKSNMKNSKLSNSRIDQGQRKVQRKFQSKKGDDYEIQIERMEKVQEYLFDSRTKNQNKFQIYQFILVSEFKVNKMKFQFQFKFNIKGEKIKQCAGHINQALADFINISQVEKRSIHKLESSKLRRSRFQNSLHDEEVQQKNGGILLDFSGFKINNQSRFKNLSKSFKQEIGTREKKSVSTSGSWFCCGKTNNDPDQQIVIDLLEQEKIFRERKKGTSVLKRNIDLFVGPCEGVNLFSFMDKRTVNRQTFSYLQPSYH